MGAAIAATRLVVHDVGPFTLAFLRYALALACFLPFARQVAASLPPFRRLLPLLLLGVLQFGVLIALLNVGLLFLPASVGAIIFSALPLVTLLLAWALGRESFSLATLGATGLVMGGVWLAVSQYPFAPDETRILPGMLAVIAATLCGAVSSLLYRQHSRGVPSLVVIVSGLAAAAASLLLPALIELRTTAAALPTAHAWPVVAFLGASSAVGFWLWLWALARAGATSVAVCVAAAPIGAAVLGTLFLDEPLVWGTVAAIACVVAALVMLYRRPEGGRVA